MFSMPSRAERCANHLAGDVHVLDAMPPFGNSVETGKSLPQRIGQLFVIWDGLDAVLECRTVRRVGSRTARVFPVQRDELVSLLADHRDSGA